jgi:hypothetical protein
MDSLELKFTYTETDYQEFLQNFFWRNRSRSYLILGVVALVVMGWVLKDSLFTPRFWISILLPIVMIAALWWGILKFSGRRAFQMTPQMLEPRSCLIDTEKTVITGQTFKSEFSWTGVQSVIETRNLVLLYSSKTSAVILPKRAFAPEQLSAFKSWVDQHPDLAVLWRS